MTPVGARSRATGVARLSTVHRLLCRLTIGITDAEYLKLQETYPPNALDWQTESGSESCYSVNDLGSRKASDPRILPYADA